MVFGPLGQLQPERDLSRVPLFRNLLTFLLLLGQVAVQL